MRVKYNTFGFKREMSLEAALTTRKHGHGVAESARESADHANEQMARLLAHFVESGAMSVQTAFQIAGVYVEDLEILP